MSAQLEIVTRRNGRFIKVQDVLVDGDQVATLHKVGKTWVLSLTGPNAHINPFVFSSRDVACEFLYGTFTSEPTTGEFSLATPFAYDQHVDSLYRETDDYFREIAQVIGDVVITL